EPEHRALRRALGAALRAFAQERRREGATLQRELLGRVATLRTLAAGIRARQPLVLEALEVRIRDRLARLAGLPELEPQRVTQEIVSLAERGDVTEEVVRLESHLAALATTLRAPGAVGKRVEFLLQEIQRELNTTGAKSADLAITGLVVEGKSEVE